MKKSDFYYNLPEELIAQHPIEPRDSSKLMFFNKETGDVSHGVFTDVVDKLNEGDCLILNDTRVLPARIYGIRTDTGSMAEFLLLNQLEGTTWEVIVGPGKKAKVGRTFDFNGKMTCTVKEVKDDGNRIVEFNCPQESFFALLDEIGQMPLPHYIHEELKDRERYQTVYSKHIGSAAAPTAGLHFTPEILEKIRSKGVNIGYVTLHVGLGTFRPVKEEEITAHKMHSEHYHMPAETAELINRTKRSGGRVICVGTTSCRTVESVAGLCDSEEIREADGWTSIFIYPGYKFKCMDALITNFHLPESTLIMLVSAFAGRENTLAAYDTAVREKYRFFSFGDAMFIY